MVKKQINDSQLPTRSFIGNALKSERAPMGKDRLPTTILQGGTVKLCGCKAKCRMLFVFETQGGTEFCPTAEPLNRPYVSLKA